MNGKNSREMYFAVNERNRNKELIASNFFFSVPRIKKYSDIAKKQTDRESIVAKMLMNITGACIEKINEAINAIFLLNSCFTER